MSDYILTYTKTIFYPLKPRIEDIKIEDIAHSLAQMARANGHFKHFYSVAQHSVNCYLEAKNLNYSKQIQLGCLLHDASEAYISDLTRPVKRNIPDYITMEERLQKLIYKKFGLEDVSDKDLLLVQEIDDVLLHYEFEELMGVSIYDNNPATVLKHDVSQKDIKEVKEQFLSCFNSLYFK
ncbi:phosphohydrolase [Desulfuribacillus alkaliarsenatis]|uniref:Phosphohydrolase n=1 Tax=Desulfuribacillus alkaliarsenatis TaxID=766136 RepID=A0A1E5G5Z9_9FIRM|nr:phosphohydrolase [Desulfuribacillus alkaliarsenatis]OEF98583.1 phosphohydrolase [Desulfuribacillus alkaliarsenatis]